MSSERVSVVKINVEDSQWKSFAAAFEKFKTSSAAQAESTKDAVEAQGKLNAEKRKGADIDKSATKEAKTERTEKAKTAKADAEDLKRKVAATDKEYQTRKKQRAEDIQHLRDTVKWTADVARNVASTAFSAAKWVAFSAIASGFGLGGLGMSASNARSTSQKLGINTGELRAANVNFGKYIDPESALGNIANAKDDGRLKYLFNQLGIGTQGKNAGDILPEMLPKLVDLFKSIGGRKDVYDDRGMNQLLSFEETRGLSQLSPEELRRTIGSYNEDRSSLLNQDGTNKAWQDFMVMLKRAGETIEVSLLDNLKTLLPYLTKFTDGIVKAVTAFVSSGGLQDGIEKVGGALQEFGAYLGSQEFKSDIQSFMDGVKGMANLLDTLGFVDHSHNDKSNFTLPPPKDDEGTWTLKGMLGIKSAPTEQDYKKANLQMLEKQFKLPAGVLDYIWSKESSRGLDPNSWKENSAGAAGDFGFRSGTAARYHVKDRYDFASSSHGTAEMLADLLKKYGGDLQKSLAAYNDGDANVDSAIKKYQGDWLKHLPNQTQNYVKVLIQNQTGGSAQATVAAMN